MLRPQALFTCLETRCFSLGLGAERERETSRSDSSGDESSERYTPSRGSVREAIVCVRENRIDVHMERRLEAER